MEGYEFIGDAEVFVKKGHSINTKEYNNNSEGVVAAITHSDSTKKISPALIRLNNNNNNNNNTYYGHFDEVKQCSRKDAFINNLKDSSLNFVKDVSPVLVDILVDKVINKVTNFINILTEEPKANKLLREKEMKKRSFTLITNQRKVG